MPAPEDFPPMMFMGLHNEQCPQYGAMRELTPQFHRPPDEIWAEHFRMECESRPSIPWQPAGFARCTQDEVTSVHDAIAAVTDAADRRFVAYLQRIAPERASDIVAAQQASEASVGTDGPFMLPIGRPSPDQIY